MGFPARSVVYARVKWVGLCCEYGSKEQPGPAFADAQCAAPFLCTSSVECATSPELCDPDHDPITTVRAFLTSAVDAAKQRGEIGSDIEGGPLVESLVALLCGVWVYVGFLGTE